MPSTCVVLVTTPRSVSRRLAKSLLKSRLAACVNIIDGLSSHYWWKGKVESAVESLLVIKTRKSLFRKLEAKVRREHPYTVPEIISLPITGGHAPYLRWLLNETKGR